MKAIFYSGIRLRAKNLDSQQNFALGLNSTVENSHVFSPFRHKPTSTVKRSLLQKLQKRKSCLHLRVGVVRKIFELRQIKTYRGGSNKGIL